MFNAPPPPPGIAETLGDRRALLHEINLARDVRQSQQRAYLIVINIADTKNYDEIIRVFGYKFADDLLSIRLADLEFLRSEYPVFHVGFWSVGLVIYPRDGEDYRAILARLTAMLARPLICRGIPVSIRAGVGVCDLTRGLGAAEDLLQAAFLAGQSGAAAPAGWAECNYDLADDHRRAFTLISHAAHSLLTPDEFQLSYQARVDLRTGYCDAVEGFLRWRHPTLGRVMPDEFVPLIEMTGLIRELTGWVIDCALTQAAAWRDGGRELRSCVKISSKNLDETDFVARVAALLATHGIAPAMLELEFSEKRAFSDIAVAHQRMKELRELGVGISLDDFGTGANTFSSLENIPANVIKVDRQLITTLHDNPRQQALVKSIIRMAHELNMQVVAEGVETPAVLDMLTAWRCDFAEGYLFNRPMPAEAFFDWLAATYPKAKPAQRRW